MKAELSNLITSYGLFSNKDEIEVDYLIMGPGCATEAESQAKANYLISVANDRKDCMATIGAHRGNLVNITNTNTQTENLINYFSSLSSSSYATFDSGYKYSMTDSITSSVMSNECDVAGLMTRTAIVAYPWFSPAGQQRGVINNAVKLAYNPNKHKEIVSILQESTPSSPHLASEHSSSVIRLHSDMLLHSTESTSVVCSLPLNKHWKEQHKLNSLNSTMS